MKTSDAQYEAIEAVSRLQAAMFEDTNDPDTNPAGRLWLQRNYPKAAEVYRRLDEMRDSFNDID